MDVILGLSLKFIWWDNQGSCESKSLQLLLRRAQMQNMRHDKFKLAQSLPLHKHLHFRQKYTKMYVTNVKKPVDSFPISTSFLCKSSSKGFFSSQRFYVSNCHRIFLNTSFCWTKCDSTRILFPHWGFTFPQSHWLSNRGDKWHEPSIYITFK